MPPTTAAYFDAVLVAKFYGLLAACRSVHLQGVNPIAPTIDR
jgi:hypothetical protein